MTNTRKLTNQLVVLVLGMAILMGGMMWVISAMAQCAPDDLICGSMP